jgi:hypothetical protein
LVLPDLYRRNGTTRFDGRIGFGASGFRGRAPGQAASYGFRRTYACRLVNLACLSPPLPGRRAKCDFHPHRTSPFVILDVYQCYSTNSSFRLRRLAPGRGAKIRLSRLLHQPFCESWTSIGAITPIDVQDSQNPPGSACAPQSTPALVAVFGPGEPPADRLRRAGAGIAEDCRVPEQDRTRCIGRLPVCRRAAPQDHRECAVTDVSRPVAAGR